MSKAEERAFEYYPNIDRKDYPCKELDAAYREVFVLGYHQAEKDLELTWEDVKKIYCIALNLREHVGSSVFGQPFYEEVLKQFKAQKRE